VVTISDVVGDLAWPIVSDRDRLVKESEVNVCAACDASCDGCIGPGPENCEVCRERHYIDDNGVCKRMSTLISSCLLVFHILKYLCLILFYLITIVLSSPFGPTSSLCHRRQDEVFADHRQKA